MFGKGKSSPASGPASRLVENNVHTGKTAIGLSREEKNLAPEGNSLLPGTGDKKLVILHRNGEKHYSNLIL
jgi:hypothetical protein